ncbi:MAG TPA: FecR domain-containing protein [Geobacteraceae bacterium]|nr:FecR domain-containing protein [Geobacteraceae bacterium]
MAGCRMFVLVCCLSFFVPLVSIASDIEVGTVKSISGTAVILRNGNGITAKAGTKVRRSDWLVTGTDGSMSVVFLDDTLLAIGPDSRLSVIEFEFSPKQGKLSFVARLIRGTAACETGMIGKLSPNSFRFETPVANIGGRGTKFAAKVSDSGK